MSKVKWGDIVATCRNQNLSAFLTEGHPPLFRSEQGLRAAIASALGEEDVVALANELIPGKVEEIPGCRSFRLAYTDAGIFRVDLLGNPNVHSLIATRLPDDAPSLLREGSGWYEGWHPDDVQIGWHQALETSQVDGLMAVGCPFFTWSALGLHAFGMPQLDSDGIVRIIDGIMPPPEYVTEKDGITRFVTRFEQGGTDFLVSALRRPVFRVALLTRLKPEAPAKARGSGVRRSRIRGSF